MGCAEQKIIIVSGDILVEGWDALPYTAFCIDPTGNKFE